jgi:hypothetical protein
MVIKLRIYLWIFILRQHTADNKLQEEWKWYNRERPNPGSYNKPSGCSTSGTTSHRDPVEEDEDEEEEEEEEEEW